MILPRAEEISFSHLAWREWLQEGEKSKFRSMKDIYEFLQQQSHDCAFQKCAAIINNVRNRRVRNLLNGYAILDLLYWCGAKFSRYQLWRLFEDLVGEILKESIRHIKECVVINVDRWPGFKGLDYVIVNSQSHPGWKVGIQCKRYIG